MNRIQAKFQTCRPFIGFLTAGDRGIDYSIEASLALVEGGVDILELGLPFSDPVADGPVIQAASQRSLSLGTTPEMVLRIIESIRKQVNIPIILFSYLNPVMQAGPSFFLELKQAGADGILLVDLPLEEGLEIFQEIKENNLSPILIATPSTSPKRLQRICDQAEGFIYYVCQKGTTGMRSHLPPDFSEKIKSIKRNTKIPVAAGFGISNREMVLDVLQAADGFVVGSAFVDVIAKGGTPEDLKILAKKFNLAQQHS